MSGTRGCPSETYDARYYACHCGSIPYERSPYWLDFWGKIADEIVRSLAPKRVLDAGCALGMLVESLWDHGVEAYGRDLSDFAISQVRPDIRQYCEVGSIADPFRGEYDLVTCIEVLEHIPEELAQPAIAAITAVAPRILFSSSPDDFDEPTHINVKPPIYWIRRFADAGFAPVVTFDGTFICHHAMLFERASGPIDGRLLLGYAEIIRLRLETLKRDKQLQALYAGAKAADKQLHAGKEQAESLKASLEIAERAAEDAAAASERREAEAAQRIEELAARELWLHGEIAARDKIIACVKQEANDLSTFRRGVYRNPFFILVRLSSRIWNMARRPVQSEAAPEQLPEQPAESVALPIEAPAPVPAPESAPSPPLLPPTVAPPWRRLAEQVGYVPPAGLLPWFTPLSIEPVPELADRPHLNILLPGIGMKYMSGGPNTALNLGYRLALMGVAVRFVSTDVAIDEDATAFWAHVRNLAGTEEQVAHVELVDAHDRALPLRIGANDIFMATAWWTAQMAKYALRHTRHGKFVYLIQDYEPLFHAASTPLALSSETYGLDFIPVINSSLLEEFLATNRVGRFADAEFAAKALVFEPAIDKSRFHPISALPTAAKRRLLFYARPTNATRNLFEIGAAALQKLVHEGKLDLDRWEIIAIGEQFVPVPLTEDYMLTPAPWFDFDSYARLMRESDVLLSMMMSPHPSYPPLEMAACGHPVVTTAFANKNRDRLASISPNIIGCDATIEAISDGLVAAIKQAESRTAPSRVPIGLPASWEASFAPVLPRLHDALLALLGAPPGEGGGRFPGFRAWPRDAYATARLDLLRERQARYCEPESGLVSLLSPVWNTDPVFLFELAETVFRQDSGPGLEWVILDNGSNRADTITALRKLAEHPCVRLARVEENIGIIGGLRNCLGRAKHRYILPLDSDDLLTPDAVRILTSSLKQAGYPAIAYSDEEKIEGERPRDAYFKPDWDPVLFVHSCYIAHLCAIDREKALNLGCYSDPAPQGSHDWDSFTRFHLAGHVPHHVPEIVYSWRMHAESTSGNFRSKDYIFASQRYVIERFVAGSGDAGRYRVEPSPLFPETPDWRIVPAGDSALAFTTILIGKGTAPELAPPADHRIASLPDARDLAALLKLAESCAAENRLVHLLRADIVTAIDPLWSSEAATLLDLFPDSVMIGGRAETNQVIVAADGYFGFGYGWDSPNRGRHVKDPGYFVQMWKPHSASTVPLHHCLLRADFLAETLRRLLGSGLDVPALAPWLGAAAAKSSRRIVYSPFFLAHSREGMPLSPSDIERASFLMAHGDLVPERRLLSPHLGLTAETAYRPVGAALRAAQEEAARAIPELAYPEAFAAELIARCATALPPQRAWRFSALTSVYARTSAALFAATAESVAAQTLPLAEWVLLENGPVPADVAAILDRLEAEGRIRRFRVPENIGIAGAMRFCLERAIGDYVLPLDADDLLTRDALQQLALALEAESEPAFVFSDEDMLEGEVPASPYRRPGFDPILNAADSYIFHLCAFRREQALALGVYSDPAMEFCHDWDSVRRFEAAGASIAHVPLVLYHWRMHQDSSSNSGRTNQGSLASTRRLLETIVAQQKRPELYEVALFPIHRGADQYAVLRRPVAPLPMALLYRTRKESVPAALLHSLGTAIGDAVIVAQDVADAAARLAQLPDEIRHVLVLQDGVVPRDAAGLWEAMRLFEMHADVGLVGGRVLDASGTVVACATPRSGETEWVGRHRGDPGSFAMALKPQSVSAVPDGLFFCRRDLIAAAASVQGEGNWARRAAIAARSMGLRLAYSPLIEAVAAPAAVPAGAARMTPFFTQEAALPQ